jgi:hypothetical protein
MEADEGKEDAARRSRAAQPKLCRTGSVASRKVPAKLTACPPDLAQARRAKGLPVAQMRHSITLLIAISELLPSTYSVFLF